MPEVKVRFWGVRGSIPAPLTAKDVEEKELAVLKVYRERMLELPRGTLIDPEKFLKEMRTGGSPATHGGNTSCVEVRLEDQIFVLDMGTGLRPFGKSVIKEMFTKKGLEIHFLLSHVHWDHIHGLPFFGPLFINKHTSNIRNKWHFHGGTNWQKTAEDCIVAQMSSPSFPVSWEAIKAQTEKISFSSMSHGTRIEADKTSIQFGQLDHPQETYGSRLVFPGNKVIAYTTDNEPRDPLDPDGRLLALAQGADVWITDCQYTLHQYRGHKDHGGVSRQGWGHSYPQAVAMTAWRAGVRTVVLFHHDPDSTDERVTGMVEETQRLIDELGGTTKVVSAWEGLELTI